MKDKKHKILVANWGGEDEKGGTEVISKNLCKTLKANLICSSKAYSSLGYTYKRYSPYAIVERTLIMGEYIQKYERLNNPKLIIRNSSIGAFTNFSTPAITIFQDPYVDVHNFFAKVGLEDKQALLEYTGFYPILQRITASSSLLNIAVSNYMKDYMRSIGCRCDVVLPNGVDTNLFKPRKKKSKLLNKNYKNYDKIGIWVGKFNPLKYSFISNFVKDNKNIFWILVFCEDIKNLRPKSKNVQVFNHISQEELAELYSSADFGISTSPVESFGLFPAEAMASNVPMVCFKTGFVNDWWDHRLGERVEEEWSYEAFNDAFKTLLKRLDKYAPRKVILNSEFTLKKWKTNLNNILKDIKK